MNRDGNIRSTAGVLGAVICAALLMGCASAKSVPTDPFQDFRDSVAQLKIQADAAIAIEQEQVYGRFVEEWKAEDTVAQLKLQSVDPATNPTSVEMAFSMQLENQPVYQLVREARETTGGINDLVLKYTETMVVLTGAGDGAAAVDADALATSLRASTDSLAKRLSIDNQISDGFFFGFGELARAYVENKRQDVLIELIRSSQPAIDAFAQQARNLAKLSGTGIRTEYNASFSKLTEGAAGLPDSQRDTLVEEILELNEQTLRNLETLRLIDAAYGALPDAHRKLEDSIRNGTSISFTELLTYAESLKTRYDEFAKE